jgi:hypothetical protein
MAEQDRRADDAGGAAKPAGERRRYNRRRPDADSTPPPYYEIFDRIASALEGIESIVRTGSRPSPYPGEDPDRPR